mmetsp:Transcript_10762/g.27661  ORF Transcript_10762/g.27661 Transcript_10762/m.27661 type:complete len:263 (-) Transcript_10762:268-1056(-)
MGDSVCGGNNFHSPAHEYEQALREVAAEERAMLGPWPMYHMAGNHDLHPVEGGLKSWLSVFGNQTGLSHTNAAYHALRFRGWRLLLLDTASWVGKDSNGHGAIGSAQLVWLHGQLESSAARNEQVILIAHQLLVLPRDSSGRTASWVQLPDDMVSNAGQVLSLLRRYPHVRLSLHGHVHANSLTTHQGIAFASLASASEYPMQWHEIIVRACEVELRAHVLGLPREVLDRSRHRENGRGDAAKRNRAKMGEPIENAFVLRTC